LTALLHLLVVVVLTWSTARPVQRPAPAVQSISAEKLHGAGEQIVEVDIRPGLATHGIACEGSSYIGVGVTADPRTDRIILVGDNTPASRAGLQHDDIVLNPGVWQHAHVDGALLHVVILRDRARLAVRVLVGRICIG
jgi:hypothetical protein